MPPAEQRKITSGSLIYNKCTISHFKCPRTLFSHFQPSRSFSAWVKRALDNRVTFVPLRCRFHLSRRCRPDLRVFAFLSNSPWKQEGRGKRKRSSASPEERRGARRSTWYGRCMFPLWMCAPEPRCCFNSAGGAAERVCWQMGFFPARCWQRRSRAIVAVNRRLGAGERCSTQALLSFSITARQRWSLLSLICIGISSISIPGMTEEQTCVDGGVKGELGPRHISFNQS